MITLLDTFEVKPTPNAYRAKQMTIYDLTVDYDEDGAAAPSFTFSERRGPRVWMSED